MPPDDPKIPPGAEQLKIENVHQLGPRLLSAAAFVQGFKPPAFLIDDLLQRGYIYSMTGSTGHGKTAVSLLLAFHVARGDPLGDKSVTKGRVVILAGENPDDIRARVLLASEAYGVDLAGLDLHFVAGVFNIEDHWQDLETATKRLGGVDLVVVDTSAAFFRGLDDNSNVEAGDHARVLRSLTRLPGQPSVLVPCHPTKHATKDTLLPRGGGAFLNEMDGNLSLWSPDGGETAELHHRGKLRGPGFEPFNFRLEKQVSSAVQDAKGRPMRSVVAWAMTETDVRESQEQIRSDEDAMLDMLLNRPTASYAEWAKALDWLSSKGNPLKSRVERALARLSNDKLIKKHRDRWKLTEMGRREAERIVGL